MDALLELIKKYKTPLNRGNQSSKDYLKSLYSSYVNDLKQALNPKLNILYGESICIKLNEKMDLIESLCEDIVGIYLLYDEGQQAKASIRAFNCFDSVKSDLMMRYTGAWRKEWYFRIRSFNDESPYSLVRKELYHVPYEKKEICSTERYSLPGYPCLYLATQAELCWYECKKPEKFSIAKFDIPQDINDTMHVIDFSEKMIPLAHSFYCWRINEKDKGEIEKIENYLCKFLVTYPLRAACSLIASYDSNVAFKEEYVIPQLLMQWINSNTDFDGIKYETVSEYDETHSFGGANIVFVSKGFDEEGYAKNMRHRVKVATPMLIDIDKIELPDWMISGKTKEQCIFGWGLDCGPEDYEYI